MDSKGLLVHEKNEGWFLLIIYKRRTREKEEAEENP